MVYSVTMKWSLIVAIVLIGGAVFAEIDDSPFPTSLQNVNLNNLPGNLSVPGNLPVDLSKAPTLEEGQKLMEEKCKKMGHPEAYEATLNAKEEVQKCVKSLVNVTELQEEMEAAKPTGDLDIVFRKYCRKSPDLLNCITNFTTTIEPCLEEQEKESKRLIQDIVDSMLKFICYKEGDRIALFIAEGGPECLSSNQESIQECGNTTVAKNLPKENLSIENLPSFVFGEEQCKDMRDLQSCVVTALERCAEPTPANIIDSMFNFVRKMTPCKNKGKLERSGGSGDTDGASMSMGTAILVLVSVFVCILTNRNLH